MSHIKKKGICLLLSATLLLLTLCADAGQITEVIDDLIHKDITAYSGEFTFTVRKLPHYDQKRTDELNDLLKHIAISIDRDNTNEKVSVLINQQPAVQMTINREPLQKRRITFDFDQELSYIIDDQVTDKMNGHMTEGIIADSYTEKALSILSGTEDLYRFISKLPVTFQPVLTEKKTHIRIKDAGVAEKEQILLLNNDSQEDTQQLENLIRNQSGYDKLLLPGKQKLVFFKDGNDRLIKMIYEGIIDNDDGGEKYKAEWYREYTDDDKTTDKITISCPSDRKRVITVSLNVSSTADAGTGGTEIFNGTMTEKYQAGKTMHTDELSVSLSLDRNLTGTINRCIKEGKKEQIQEITIDIGYDKANESRGKAEVRTYLNTELETDYQINYSVLPVSTVEIPDEHSIIDIGSMNDEEKEQLNDWIKREITVRIISALITLPEDDLGFLKRDIPENDWKMITDMYGR